MEISNTPILDKILNVSRVCIYYDSDTNTLGVYEACDYYYKATHLNKLELQEFIKELQSIERVM
jgi:hypothetical protein